MPIPWIAKENIGEAMPVDANVMYFHDWRYVHPGYPDWVTPTGMGEGLMVEAKPPDTRDNVYDSTVVSLYDHPAHVRDFHSDTPVGIHLQAKKPTLDKVDFAPDCVIKDASVYRGWYRYPVKGKGSPFANMVMYCESDDGYNWRKPDLGIVDMPDMPDRNATDFRGEANIFVDPSCDPAQRYKAFYLDQATQEQERKYRTRRLDAIDPYCYRAGVIWSVFGATSGDGLHWTKLDEPVLMHQSDTQNMCYWDQHLGKYVGYLRMRYLHRRAIGRSQTDDFANFPQPRMIDFSWVGADMSPSEEWYGPFGMCLYPGTTRHHLMFPNLWKVHEDLNYVGVAASYDGEYWKLVPGGPLISPGRYGEPDGGGVWAKCGLVSLPAKRVGMVVGGVPMPHKYPFRPSHPPGITYWATWPRDRLVALVADGHGSFRTRTVSFDGNEIHIDAQTKFVGVIRVQVMDEKFSVLPGRSFADCDPIIGNVSDKAVTWRGEANIGRQDQQPVKLWFQLYAAELFSLRFV